MNVQNNPLFSNRMSSVLRILNEIIAELEHEGIDPAWKTQAMSIASQLESGRFLLAFVGDWNSGKSSLINKLIGFRNCDDSLLPVSDEPTTSRITTIRHGNEPRLYKIPIIDHQTSGPVAIATGMDDVKMALRNHGSAQESANDGDLTDEYELLVEWNAPILKSGLIIVDTPGLSDPNRLRSMLTDHYMQLVHGVVVVTPSTRPVTDELLGFLRNRVIKNRMEKLFFVLNKTDQLENDSEISDHLNFLANETQSVFAESSKKKSSGNRYFSTSCSTESGLEPLFSELDEFGWKGALSSVRELSINRIGALFDQIRIVIQREFESSQSKLGDWKNKLELLNARKKVLEENIQHRINTFISDWNDITEKACYRTREIVESQVKETRAKIEISRKAIIGRVTPHRLSRDISKIIEHCDQEVSNRLSINDSKINSEITLLLQRMMYDLRSTVQNERKSAGISYEIPIPETNSNNRQSETNLPNAASIAAGVGVAGGALAFSAGVGAGTAVVSTLPAWVPGFISSGLSTVGIGTTTVATFSFASLIPFIALPSSAAWLGYHIWNTYKNRKTALDAGEAYIESLSNAVDTYSADYKKDIDMRLSAFQEVLENSMKESLNSIESELARYANATENQQVSSESTRLLELIQKWESQLNDLHASY